ncbi:hypothetical protein THRCLA_21792 [Thraustotheca clavata]|uniref:Crinkler (CRN) family protein n=1 Tax=Thraustotheca clavata TaxID=74557 RepID=A0A1V9ZP63_9STRA|nr:hypothetical protein THRCLA_21792 [Thraustotheca clavata]
MEPSCSELDAFLQGKDVKALKLVHAIFVVPNDPKADVISSGEMLKEVYEQPIQAKRKRYEYSELKQIQGRDLLQEFNLKVEALNKVTFLTDTNKVVEPFQWVTNFDLSGEEIIIVESKKCIGNKLKRVLDDEKLSELAVEKYQNILSVGAPGHDIELVGHADLLILSKQVLAH